MFLLKAGAITADYKMNVYSKKMPDDPEAVKQMWDDVMHHLFNYDF